MRTDVLTSGPDVWFSSSTIVRTSAGGPFDLIVTTMCVLASVAAMVNAAELWRLRVNFSASGTWRAATLAKSWGLLAPTLAPRGFSLVLLMQFVAAAILPFSAGTELGAACAATLALSTLLSAMRFGGTVNGGSDAMLFTVLVALSVAQLGGASTLLGEGALLYVAAQTTLSYLRAGVVKVRERAWFTGEALRAFLAMPAYGVPTSVPRGLPLLRFGGISVACFELLAPIAWLHPTLCLAYIVLALAFHAGAALLFGLNRFLLAWASALPSLWFAMHRIHT